MKTVTQFRIEDEDKYDPNNLGYIDENGLHYFYFYHAKQQATTKNAVTFFIPDEDINAEDLIRYKEQTETRLLIAVDTFGRNSWVEGVADVVIDCWYGEADSVMTGIMNMLENGFMGIDLLDIITFLSTTKNPIKFHQMMGYGDDCFAIATAKILPEIQDKNLTGIMMNLVVYPDFSFEELENLLNEIRKNTPVDDANIMWQVVCDEYWNYGEKGCDINLFLRYGAYEYVEPKPEVYTPKVNLTAINPNYNPKNSIQEYLKSQKQKEQ